MNYAFGNDCRHIDVNNNLSSCHLVQAPREAVEAKLVAEIASRAIRENKTVLVITPDAAGGQRISDELNVNPLYLSASSNVGASGQDVIIPELMKHFLYNDERIFLYSISLLSSLEYIYSDKK